MRAKRLHFALILAFVLEAIWLAFVIYLFVRLVT